MGCVCKPDGQILFEHGRSDAAWLGRFQDWRSNGHAKSLGGVWNREPLEMVHDAGLSVISSRRSFLGILHTIVAAP